MDAEHPYLPRPDELQNYQAYNEEFADVREYLNNSGHEVPHRVKLRNY